MTTLDVAASVQSRVQAVFDIVAAENHATAKFILGEATRLLDLSVCPNCGEYRPGDAAFIAEHGRCFTCRDLADDAKGGAA